ncbi:MAG: hypothetical protein MUO53_01690 [Maribacter sp.]|nr:hypothetical protein [Maribacter sp.]
MKSWFWLLFAIFISCHGQRKTVGEKSPEEKQVLSRMPMELLIQDNYGGTELPETLVIRNEKSLRSFFSKINRTRKPGLPVPKVDFSKDMVIIYCAGAQEGGIAPSLSLVEETDQKLIFKPIKEIDTRKSESTAHIVPFCVYKIPLTTKEIRFKGVE